MLEIDRISVFRVPVNEERPAKKRASKQVTKRWLTFAFRHRGDVNTSLFSLSITWSVQKCFFILFFGPLFISLAVNTLLAMLGVNSRESRGSVDRLKTTRLNIAVIIGENLKAFVKL